MNILEVNEDNGCIVKTDETYMPFYWRRGPDEWLHRVNGDWLPYRFCEDVEEAYQTWKRKQG